LLKRLAQAKIDRQTAGLGPLMYRGTMLDPTDDEIKSDPNVARKLYDALAQSDDDLQRLQGQGGGQSARPSSAPPSTTPTAPAQSSQAQGGGQTDEEKITFWKNKYEAENKTRLEYGLDPMPPIDDPYNREFIQHWGIDKWIQNNEGTLEFRQAELENRKQEVAELIQRLAQAKIDRQTNGLGPLKSKNKVFDPTVAKIKSDRNISEKLKRALAESDEEIRSGRRPTSSNTSKKKK